jgi:hypothetical protein
MCSISAGAGCFYPTQVKSKATNSEDAKRRAVLAVSRWRDRILKRRGWTSQTWADEAKVSATTLTRSMGPEHGSTAKLETLHVLAVAAGVPSVIDYLEGRAVNAAALRPVLAELLPLTRKGRWSDQDIEHLAQALEYGLGLTPSDPANLPMQGSHETAARAAADRFHELSAQS